MLHLFAAELRLAQVAHVHHHAVHVVGHLAQAVIRAPLQPLLQVALSNGPHLLRRAAQRAKHRHRSPDGNQDGDRNGNP